MKYRQGILNHMRTALILVRKHDSEILEPTGVALPAGEQDDKFKELRRLREHSEIAHAELWTSDQGKVRDVDFSHPDRKPAPKIEIDPRANRIERRKKLESELKRKAEKAHAERLKKANQKTAEVIDKMNPKANKPAEVKPKTTEKV